MRKRKSKQPDANKLILAKILGVVLFVVFTITGHSFESSIIRDNVQVSNWCYLKRRDILRDKRGQFKWISSDELLKRVVDKYPVERPETLGKSNLKGDVTIQVMVNPTGKIICTHGLRGNPIGIAAALLSVHKWTFKPYKTIRKPIYILSELTISYDFS